MCVSIERSGDCIMSEDFGKGFNIDPVFQSHCCEGVAQIVEADVLASGVFKDS